MLAVSQEHASRLLKVWKMPWLQTVLFSCKWNIFLELRPVLLINDKCVRPSVRVLSCNYTFKVLLRKRQGKLSDIRHFKMPNKCRSNWSRRACILLHASIIFFLKIVNSFVSELKRPSVYFFPQSFFEFLIKHFDLQNFCSFWWVFTKHHS